MLTTILRMFLVLLSVVLRLKNVIHSIVMNGVRRRFHQGLTGRLLLTTSFFHFYLQTLSLFVFLRHLEFQRRIGLPINGVKECQHLLDCGSDRPRVLDVESPRPACHAQTLPFRAPQPNVELVR